MLNINVSKLSSLIESKKHTINLNNSNFSSNLNTSNASSAVNQNNKSNTLTNNQSQSSHPSNQNIKNKIPPFKVQSYPSDKFPLFQRKDFYHYNKKFHNDLPNVICPPISFHYTSSNENFCSFDIMTMMFGLKKSQEILTDSKLNTKIHKDFINNSFNLIFPDKSLSIESQLISKNMKDDIINIINSKEDSEIALEKAARKKEESNIPFYLRRTTLISSALNLKKKNSSTIKNIPINNNNGHNEFSLANLKKSIENTFESIDKITEGSQHPQKKNLYAKNVYQILPFYQFSSLNMTQIIFPNDPLTDIQVDESDKNYVLPDKFLLKKEENVDELQENDKNDIYSFFKNEKFIEENLNPEELNNNQNILDEKNKLKSAEYYSYEREYQVNFSNENELFNRHLIFLDKENKVAKLLPLNAKVYLKKYKKVIPVNVDEDNYEMEKPNIGRKRERDLIVFPKNIDEDDSNVKDNLLNDNGVCKEFVGIDIGSPCMDEIEKARERIIFRENPVKKERRDAKEEVEENYFSFDHDEENLTDNEKIDFKIEQNEEDDEIFGTDNLDDEE